MSSIGRLTARVKAVNQANQGAMDVYAALSPVFAPLVGQKITKVGGEFTKKVKDKIDEVLKAKFPYQNYGVHVYRYDSKYSVVFVAKTCVQVPDEESCLYAEASAYIGEFETGERFERGNFKGISNPPALKTDYTVEDILAKREAYKVAKKAADDAKSALHPFDEYDR